MREPRERKQHVIFITIFIINGSIDYGAQEEVRCRSSPVHLKGSATHGRRRHGDAEAHEDVDAAGGEVGAGGAITTSPMAGTEVGGIGGEQHQQRLDGHAPQGVG